LKKSLKSTEQHGERDRDFRENGARGEASAPARAAPPALKKSRKMLARHGQARSPRLALRGDGISTKKAFDDRFIRRNWRSMTQFMRRVAIKRLAGRQVENRRLAVRRLAVRRVAVRRVYIVPFYLPTLTYALLVRLILGLKYAYVLKRYAIDRYFKTFTTFQIIRHIFLKTAVLLFAKYADFLKI
jgi:hypothetical protein